MVKKRWVVLNEDGRDLKKALLKDRNISDQKTFFEPHLYKLSSPDKFFPELAKAVARIKRAIKNKELIYIYGDFDVDGITAAAILWETIDFLGGKVLPYIPHREKEGYGIHLEALENLTKEGAKVIISVDCGITAVVEAKAAKKLGVDLIITDHHLKPKELPDPFATLHTEKLAGSGVSFMLAKAILESYSRENSEQLYKNLGLAAIGTIADMVPLLGDNRIITANGLHNLSRSERVGLKALYEEAALTKKIGTYEVGFIISPRLNAAGRMEHAMDALRLLLTKSKSRAGEIAAKLSETNKQRQEATASALSHAREAVAAKGAGKIIFVHHESYQQGIVGLVAGRLAEEHHRPAVVISATSPLSKGSARSIARFNISEAVKSAKELLISHGGHPMAAGFSLKPENIKKFEEKILNYAEKNLNGEDLTPTLKIDFSLDQSQLNYKTLEIVRGFEPFGMGNREPVFVSFDFEVKDFRKLGKEGKHLRMVLRDAENSLFDAIAFGFGEERVRVGDKIDVAYHLKEDTWNGNKKIELKIKDFRASKN